MERRYFLFTLWAALSAALLFATASAAEMRGAKTEMAKISQDSSCLEAPCHLFRVEIDGLLAGHFSAVEGLSIEQEVIEYQDGSDPIVRKRPGRLKYGDITLKKGFIASTMLNDWIEAARLGQGDFTKMNLSIILLDASQPGSGTELKRWNLFEAFPRSWKLNTMDGKGNDVLTEEMVLVIEWFEEA